MLPVGRKMKAEIPANQARSRDHLGFEGCNPK